MIEDGAENYQTEELPVRPSKSRGVELPIKLQLSTGKELKLTVHSTDTILVLKRQIQSQEGVGTSRQRLFFAGRQLTDRMRIKDAKVRKNYTIQVIISEPAPNTVVAPSSIVPIMPSETEDQPPASRWSSFLVDFVSCVGWHKLLWWRLQSHSNRCDQYG